MYKTKRIRKRDKLVKTYLKTYKDEIEDLANDLLAKLSLIYDEENKLRILNLTKWYQPVDLEHRIIYKRRLLVLDYTSISEYNFNITVVDKKDVTTAGVFKTKQHLELMKKVRRKKLKMEELPYIHQVVQSSLDMLAFKGYTNTGDKEIFKEKYRYELERKTNLFVYGYYYKKVEEIIRDTYVKALKDVDIVETTGYVMYHMIRPKEKTKMHSGEFGLYEHIDLVRRNYNKLTQLVFEANQGYENCILKLEESIVKSSETIKAELDTSNVLEWNSKILEYTLGVDKQDVSSSRYKALILQSIVFNRRVLGLKENIDSIQYNFRLFGKVSKDLIDKLNNDIDELITKYQQSKENKTLYLDTEYQAKGLSLEVQLLVLIYKLYLNTMKEYTIGTTTN